MTHVTRDVMIHAAGQKQVKTKTNADVEEG